MREEELWGISAGSARNHLQTRGVSRQSAHQLPVSRLALALICPVLALSVVLMTHYVNTNDNHYTLCCHCQPHLSSHQFSLYAQFDKLPKVSEQCAMYNYPPSIPFPFLPSFLPFPVSLSLLPCACPSLPSLCVVAACVLVLYDPALFADAISFFLLQSIYIILFFFSFIISYYSFLYRYIDILIIYIIYISIYKYIGAHGLKQGIYLGAYICVRGGVLCVGG